MKIKTMNSVAIKAFLSSVLGIVIDWGIPIRPFILIVLALVVCDWITGVKKAKLKGEEIRSKGLRRTTEKFAFYALAILLSQGMKTVFFPSLPLVYFVSAYIAITEFKSNLENITSITGVDLIGNLMVMMKNALHLKN